MKLYQNFQNIYHFLWKKKKKKGKQMQKFKHLSRFNGIWKKYSHLNLWRKKKICFYKKIKTILRIFTEFNKRKSCSLRWWCLHATAWTKIMLLIFPQSPYDIHFHEINWRKFSIVFYLTFLLLVCVRVCVCERERKLGQYRILPFNEN
jgi:hypothetical protein